MSGPKRSGLSHTAFSMVLSKVDPSQPNRARPLLFDHSIAVRRTQLHQLLLDAVNAEGSVMTRFGCTVMSADPSGSLVVRSGPGGGGPTASTLHADLVVGADGVNSAVRSTGGFYSRLSAGSSYVRTIVQGHANPGLRNFGRRWDPLDTLRSAGTSPTSGPLHNHQR